MSHELRTPLNSLLILSKLLTENPDGNLTRQAGRVRADDPRRRLRPAGADQRHPRPVEDRVRHGQPRGRRVSASATSATTSSAPSARSPRSRSSTSSSRSTPTCRATMRTDAKRLQQVLKNLLSNAFKFTEEGGVTLQDRLRPERIADCAPAAGLDRRFPVSDTGIGIPEDKQRIIFEAFQQADGTTSRKYGGTGLGLSISREIARLLGGEIVRLEPAGPGLDLHAVPADRAAGDERGGVRARAYAPERQRLGHAPIAASAADGAVGLRRRPGRHRAPAITSCSSSRTTRCSPRSCSSSRARRASRA